MGYAYPFIAIVHNVAEERTGEPPSHEGTWNTICLDDRGDTGVAFVTLPQIPPRNVHWLRKGKWVHVAKIAFEKYLMRKMQRGASEPLYDEVSAQGSGGRARAVKELPDYLCVGVRECGGFRAQLCSFLFIGFSFAGMTAGGPLVGATGIFLSAPGGYGALYFFAFPAFCFFGGNL